MGPPTLAQRVRELGATFIGFELLPQPTLAPGAMVEENIDELVAFTCSSVLTRYTEGIGADIFSGIMAPFVRQARLDLRLPGLLAEAPLMPQLMDSATLDLAGAVLCEAPFGLKTGLEACVCIPLGLGASLGQDSTNNSGWNLRT